jgi:hypothetical protein
MKKESDPIVEKLFQPLDSRTTLADEKLRVVLLDQYKLYVEMADRISARRQNANTFALSINTALIALIGYVQSQDSAALKEGLFWSIAVAGLILNFAWYRMVRSYRDLNTAKYKVIHEIEKRLVISPYDAEWEAVGRGRNSKLYLPFTHIEIWIPWLFFALHFLILMRTLAWARLLAALSIH